MLSEIVPNPLLIPLTGWKKFSGYVPPAQTPIFASRAAGRSTQAEDLQLNAFHVEICEVILGPRGRSWIRTSLRTLSKYGSMVAGGAGVGVTVRGGWQPGRFPRGSLSSCHGVGRNESVLHGSSGGEGAACPRRGFLGKRGCVREVLIDSGELGEI